MRAAALCALSVVLLGCSASTSPTAAVGPASSSRTGPVISAPPTSATPPGALGPFACNDVTANSAGTARVTDVRVYNAVGYDEFVLQFDGPVPSYAIKRQAKPIFAQSPSGQPLTLSGTSGVLVSVNNAHASATYAAGTDFTKADFPVLKEARLLEDFEGHVQWGLGLGSAACLRVTVATGPARLVVDFQTPSS